MNFKEILDKIENVVCEDRMKTHGDPYDQFGLTAQLWSAWLQIPISRADVAIMMGMSKDSRSKFGEYNFDDYFDKLGYALIGAHVAEREHNKYTCTHETHIQYTPYFDTLCTVCRSWKPSGISEKRWVGH